ncbi:MAG: aminotransferase class IV [Clostridia bacterium]|nr:aminotransferase class IV [Clostridia bacterium]
MDSAYYNGHYAETDKIRIPLSDRAVYFGDGIYDAAIGRAGEIYLEEEHLNRFFENAERLNLKTDVDRAALSNILKTVAENSGYARYFLYFQLTRNAHTRTHAYPSDARSNLLVTATELKSATRGGVKLITVPDLRHHLCNVKTLNLIPSVMASRRAAECGCDEAIFIRDGIVTECAHSNLLIVKEGAIYTHPTDNLILPGITRARIEKICKCLTIPFYEKRFGVEELYSADEVIISSTSKFSVKATHIDGIKLAENGTYISSRLRNELLLDFNGKSMLKF